MSDLYFSDEKNRVERGTLYLVATPIGNLADLSDRAKKILNGVDFIAAEDTRNTGKLLSILGISRPLVSYHEHNKRERGPAIIERLAGGEACALVTDAGTPAISDPGEDLVALAAAHGITVTAVPGCAAFVTALILSALPTARFCFEGFLPMEKAARRKRLNALAAEERTMILHEAPHKLRATLDDLAATLGKERQIALCRELTKKNEEIRRCSLEEAVRHYTEHEPRGEYVLVLAGGPAAAAAGAENPLLSLEPEQHVAYYMEQGMKKMDAIKAAARDRSLPKNEFYRTLVEEKENNI